MASFTCSTSNQYISCKVNASEISTNASANTSVVRVTVTYTRTNSWQGNTQDPSAQTTITCDGQTYSEKRNIQINSTGGAAWSTSFSHDFTITHNSDGGKTISYCYQCTNASHGFNVTTQQCSGSYNANLTLTKFDRSTAPTLSTWEYKGCTWNSVSERVVVSSWGNGATQKYLELMVGDSSNTQTSGTFGTWSRRAKIFNNTSDCSGAVSNSDTAQGSGTFNIRGCTSFRLGVYASNGPKEARNYPGSVPVRYTPPSPLTTLRHSDTMQATNVKVTLTIVGGNSTNNNSVNVTTQYRKNVANGGWSDWVTVGSAATPWTSKTASFEVGYGQAVQIQARQVYQGAASETKSISWTVTGGTNPTMGSCTVKSMTWNSVVLALSGFNYGMPSGMADRLIEGGIGASSNTGAFWGSKNRRWANKKAVTAADLTINNSSAVDGGFTLKGLTPFKYGAGISNTRHSATSQWSDTIFVLPPAPITASIAQKNNADDVIAANVTLTSSSANNLAGTIWYHVDYTLKGGARQTNQGSHTVGSTITVTLSNLESNAEYFVRAYDVAHKKTNAFTGSEWQSSENKDFTYYTAAKKPEIQVVEVGDTWTKIHYKINVGKGAKGLSLCADVTIDGVTKTEYLAYTTSNLESEAYITGLQGNTENALVIYLKQETTNQKSNSVNIKVTPRAGFSNLYGSVDSKAVKINKLYAPVGNKAVALHKLYIGDETGKARLVYEE